MPGPYRTTKKGHTPFHERKSFLLFESFFVYFLLEESKSAGLLADVGEDAAVNVEDQAVDEVGSLGGEEDSGAAQILGLAPALGRGLGNDELVKRMTAAVGLDLTQGCGLRGGDVAGSDAVALDVVLAVLGGDVLGQHLQTALGSGVGGDSLAAQLAHHGADVDDLAAALLDHIGNDSLGDDEGGVQVNVDDLTYTKIRFDAESQAFAEANLHRFDDALARAVTWLAFWDMTRDGEFPAERFVDMTLRLLATETESTTFRYALACMGTTAHHYVAPARRDDVLRHVAAELWTLANAAEAGSDTQFQLATAYLGYGEEGDAAFAANAHGLLDGTVRLEGLEIDNNFTWTIVQALTSVNEMTNDDADAQLAKKETTENREFAYGARASMATTQAKEWAWDQALHNNELTNSQLEAVARGFSATPRPDLAEPFAAKYFETVDWVWANKTYHMAEALLNGLYPGYADPATLVKLGDAWLDEHIAADNALKRLIVENVASSHRTLKVREYNEAL